MTQKKAAPAKASKPASAPAKNPAPAKLKKGLVVGEQQIMIGGTVYATWSEVPAELIDDEVRGYLVEGEVVDAEEKTPLAPIENVTLTADSDRLGTDPNAGDPVNDPVIDENKDPANDPQVDPATWLPMTPPSEEEKKDNDVTGL